MPGSAGYFVDGRVVNFLQGYAHVAIAQRDTRLHRWFLRPLQCLLSFLLPVRYMAIPGTVYVRDEEEARAARYRALSLSIDV